MTSGCTSFAVHNEFLVLTTTAHLLRFLSLNSVPKGERHLETNLDSDLNGAWSRLLLRHD